MSRSLALTALLMGLAGGPHCVAMCGLACAGLGQAAGVGAARAMLGFQLGRLMGYALLGGVTAASVNALGWLTIQSASLRPVWSLLHVAALVLGALLVWQGRQPIWIDAAAQRLWRQVRYCSTRYGQGAPVLVGACWALMPCGLLYSALMVAALSANVAEGAVTMALFALGSSISLWAAPWLLLKLNKLGQGTWAIRLAGLALMVIAAWALWMGLMHNQAPWCLTPGATP